MKEKMKTILLGIVLIIAAFLAPVVLEGFTVYLLGFIPLNGTVVAWIFGIIGALALLMGILEKKKD